MNFPVLKLLFLEHISLYLTDRKHQKPVNRALLESWGKEEIKEVVDLLDGVGGVDSANISLCWILY